ncbi:hypothetical protein LUZ62_055140 [Rhynchospora pubera]|uniref:Uncharacterized protein n=1 Tax=Rhynchospora pubera TaxID=906938 RepID=A0AAV8DX83_9POAL|nr:hypothetical protein LUZ62_055140 [Rhynchospora pubera]
MTEIILYYTLHLWNLIKVHFEASRTVRRVTPHNMHVLRPHVHHTKKTTEKKKMEDIQHVEINIAVPPVVSEVRSNTGIMGLEEDVAAEELEKFMKKKLDEVSDEPFKLRPVTIFRLPVKFYENNKDLFEPKIVSIGPYHHDKESVQAMEENKWSTLRDFLARNKNVGFEVYLREMRLLEGQARQCYSETVNLKSKDFVMMLLLDGCFILEFLLKLKAKDWLGICSLNWAIECLSSDLCLLENQIPFFVIHKLFENQNGCGQNCDQGLCPLLNLIYEVMPWPMKEFRFRQPQISCSQIQHLLHLYYTGVLPDNQLGGEQREMVTGESCLRGSPWPSSILQSAESTDIESSSSKSIPCASKLHQAGVIFRRKRSPRDMFDISFQYGIMEIPYIQIDSNLKKYLWNMVVFEQSQRFKLDQILISYVALMSSLIYTDIDVAILEESNITPNYLKNDELVATFFNQSCESYFGLNYTNHYFHGVFNAINEYNETIWNKYRARLMRVYFRDPWTSILVMQAAIILVLTVLQTYYSAAK